MIDGNVLRATISYCHTENNKLGAADGRNLCSNDLDTEINAGVSGLYRVDVEVTYDVCSVVHGRHAESSAVDTACEPV